MKGGGELLTQLKRQRSRGGLVKAPLRAPEGGVQWGARVPQGAAHLDEGELDEAADEDAVELEDAGLPATRTLSWEEQKMGSVRNSSGTCSWPLCSEQFRNRGGTPYLAAPCHP